ncbi:LptF/LptG family permease [uncultured Prevotella sp.]|jgi:lipopolysaccharide export system permease protein|uniref:LptF/LptG family permease n=1 Tax=uncultured Prevotella sp. TaxID=159272 RepID=UPI002614968B|nr:LptF/LptG family permease [uncultured Prevotella sp.]
MFRIKKLDIFIAKQFGMLFVGTFFICQFVLMMQFLWRYVDELIGKGLSMEVLAQFFWYMSLMLVPQALPLAILLSSLITFGNLGESSELTAIKAAGISLMQAFRSLIAITLIISGVSFYFQNVVGPNANMQFAQLLMSMKQKSPELEIPEGVFYDGIPNCNLYVQKKNVETGKLYGIMIYRMTNSFEDAAIILADSGMLQSTAEKKHLVLTLHSGEWFENMKSSDVTGSANVPYRRETFTSKRIVLDFDNDFNLADASSLSNNAKAKSLSQIFHDMDSIRADYDSIGRSFYCDAMMLQFGMKPISRKDSLRAQKLVAEGKVDAAKSFEKLPADKKLEIVNRAISTVQNNVGDLEFKAMVTKDGDKLLRQHSIEAINKFTLALSCLIFFFIGAPLGAIIRKGGLGVPVIISVLVFIVYYIFDNTGYRMARGGMWAVWFGKSIAVAVLTPLAVFFTYKANCDSVVFNVDAYRNLLMKILGMRVKRSISRKDVIIEDSDYRKDADEARWLAAEAKEYSMAHKLKTPPNFINVFFKYQPDHAVEEIGERMETMISDLSNSRDRMVINLINEYPMIMVKAHTRPFERKWMNVVAAVIVPVGLFFYFRMWRFRLRLMRDLVQIEDVSGKLANRLDEMNKN